MKLKKSIICVFIRHSFFIKIKIMYNLLKVLSLAIFILVSCQEEATKSDSTTPPPPVPKTMEKPTETTNPAKKLVEEMVEASGGLEQFKKLQDVVYDYTYRDSLTGKQDASKERYIFKDEMSWGTYHERNYRMFPEREGKLVQCFDGEKTWASLDSRVFKDPSSDMVKKADFNRKTNYYWLTMMYKLLDDGLKYELMDKQEVNGINYNKVKVTFGENVGDAQDIYVLYLNPETKLVDQFLFTVMDVGREKPLLMVVKYDTVYGLKWPTYRRYAAADWDGNLEKSPKWTLEISEKLLFNQGLNPAFFVQ